MFAYRSVAALALVASFAATTSLQASAGTAIVIDGSTRAVPVNRESGAIMIALVPLAKALGLAVRHTSRGLDVNVDGTWMQVSAKDLTVLEDGVPAMRLALEPRVHAGQLYVSAADLSNLLDVAATVRGNQVSIETDRHKSPAEVLAFKEVATPTPQPTLAPVKNVTTENEVPAGRHSIGQASFEMNSQADSRYFSGMFDGRSGIFHASLFTNGDSLTHPSLGGSLTIGTGAKHAVLGSYTDPLYGNIFIQGATTGAQMESASGTAFSWGNTPFWGRRIVAASRTHAHTKQTVAFVSSPLTKPQMLIGSQTSVTTARSQFDREVWVGEHGIGAAIHYRTGGRLYLEERLGFAGGGLPVIPGDAPTQINAGYDLSQNFGTRLGFDASRGQYAQPFVQIYGHAGALSATLAHQSHGNVATLGFSGEKGDAFVDYGSSLGAEILSASAQLETGRGLARLNAFSTGNQSHDAWFDYQFRRLGPSLTLGVETVASGTLKNVGPIVGAAVPVTRTLSARIEVHPLVHGSGLRFSMEQMLTARDHVSPTRFISVASVTASSAPVLVLVDGLRTATLVDASSKVAVPDGSHYISLQTQDGTLGSPETRIVNGSPATISLPLWPLYEVRGVVQLPKDAATAFVNGPPSVAYLTVVMQPGNIITQTDATGAFAFPAQAVAPGSTVALDSSSVPPGAAAGPPQPPSATTPVTLTIQPSKKVQKIIF